MGKCKWLKGLGLVAVVTLWLNADSVLGTAREGSDLPTTASEQSRLAAIAPFLKEASEALSKGDFVRANAALERALRIDPNNAEVWHEFALLRLAEGDLEQAEAMLSKSQALSAGKREIQRRNDQLLATIGAGTPVSETPGHAKDPARTVVIEPRIEETESPAPGKVKPPVEGTGEEPQIAKKEGEHRTRPERFGNRDGDNTNSFVTANSGRMSDRDRFSGRARTHPYRRDMQSRVFQERPIPPGHLPPPGKCRVWYSGRPPGHQPPPGDCEALGRTIPDGAKLIARGRDRARDRYDDSYERQHRRWHQAHDASFDRGSWKHAGRGRDGYDVGFGRGTDDRYQRWAQDNDLEDRRFLDRKTKQERKLERRKARQARKLARKAARQQRKMARKKARRERSVARR